MKNDAMGCTPLHELLQEPGTYELFDKNNRIVQFEVRRFEGGHLRLQRQEWNSWLPVRALSGYTFYRNITNQLSKTKDVNHE